MSKAKMCYRTVSSDNYEPSACIGDQCTMHGSIGGLTGCLVSINHTVNIMESLERQQAKAPAKIEMTEEPKVVTEKEAPVEEVVETKPETPDILEDTDEGETDSRTCNLLEGGADTPVQHDSDSSSSPS